MLEYILHITHSEAQHGNVQFLLITPTYGQDWSVKCSGSFYAFALHSHCVTSTLSMRLRFESLYGLIEKLPHW